MSSVFCEKRPERLTVYRSPKWMRVERTEKPITPGQLAPSLREALGNLGNLMAIKVSGGEWHHLPVSELDPDSEGLYTTTETDETGLTKAVHYSISPTGKVGILPFSFNWSRLKSEILDSLSDKNKYNNKFNNKKPWEDNKPTGNDRPIRSGAGATVKLEPVPGTDLKAPVLRYTESVIRLPSPSAFSSIKEIITLPQPKEFPSK